MKTLRSGVQQTVLWTLLVGTFTFLGSRCIYSPSFVAASSSPAGELSHSLEVTLIAAAVGIGVASFVLLLFRVRGSILLNPRVDESQFALLAIAAIAYSLLPALIILLLAPLTDTFNSHINNTLMYSGTSDPFQGEHLLGALVVAPAITIMFNSLLLFPLIFLRHLFSSPTE